MSTRIGGRPGATIGSRRGRGTAPWNAQGAIGVVSRLGREQSSGSGDQSPGRMPTDEPSADHVLSAVTYGDPAGVDPADLVALLDRHDADERRAGAEALARLASTAPERVEPHASAVDGHLVDDDPAVRAHLLCSLASVAQGSPFAVPVTDRVLDGLADDDPRVCEWAALAVAYVGVADDDERRLAVERLSDLLEADRSSVRRNACLGLGRLGGDAADAVRPLLDDPDEVVRDTARRVHRQADR